MLFKKLIVRVIFSLSYLIKYGLIGQGWSNSDQQLKHLDRIFSFLLIRMSILFNAISSLMLLIYVSN